MGREVRRVPPGWEHPRDENGHYIPMYDREYEIDAQEWMEGLTRWENCKDPDRAEYEEETGRRCYYWEWTDAPPDRESYRPAFDSEPTCYQIYETVSEGTPVSPVFETKEKMVEWLVTQGHSRPAAEVFAKGGWAPSMIVTSGPAGVSVLSNIDAMGEITPR